MWGSLLTALAGKYLQDEEEDKYRSRQERELRYGRREAADARRRQRGAVEDVLEEFQPEKRKQRLETAQADTTERIKAVLDPMLETEDSGAKGRVSDAVLAQRGQNARDLANTASVLAALKGRLGGFSGAGREESRKALTSSDEARRYGRDAGRAVDRARLRTSLVEKPDSTKMLLGGLAQAYGLSSASGDILSALGKGGSAPSVVGGMSPNPNYVDPFASVRSIR